MGSKVFCFLTTTPLLQMASAGGYQVWPLIFVKFALAWTQREMTIPFWLEHLNVDCYIELIKIDGFMIMNILCLTKISLHMNTWTIRKKTHDVMFFGTYQCFLGAQNDTMIRTWKQEQKWVSCWYLIPQNAWNRPVDMMVRPLVQSKSLSFNDTRQI